MVRGASPSSESEMKASSSGEQHKLNGGNMNRRPSYPGELRAKHARRSARIWVKVAMAVAYFMCVSVAAFVLVIYYVFFWKPSDPQHNNSTSVNASTCPPRSG